MCASADKDLASLSDSHSVEAGAKERLQMAPDPPIRFISGDSCDGKSVLPRQVPAFLQKQLAPEAIFRLDNVTQVFHHVEVVEHSSNGG